jgi:hypothetical protein
VPTASNCRAPAPWSPACPDPRRADHLVGPLPARRGTTGTSARRRLPPSPLSPTPATAPGEWWESSCSLPCVPPWLLRRTLSSGERECTQAGVHEPNGSRSHAFCREQGRGVQYPRSGWVCRTRPCSLSLSCSNARRSSFSLLSCVNGHPSVPRCGHRIFPIPGSLRGLGGADEASLELVLEQIRVAPDVQ